MQFGHHHQDGHSRKLEELTGTRIDPGRAALNTLGLNHLTWHRGFTVDGEEMWPHILQRLVERLKLDPEPEWDANLIETLGMLPNDYLQYFYYTGHKLAAQEKWPPSRAEQVMEIEKDLLRLYADPNLTEPPAELMNAAGHTIPPWRRS